MSNTREKIAFIRRNLSEDELVALVVTKLEPWWDGLEWADQRLLMRLTESRKDGKGESARVEELSIRLQADTTDHVAGDRYGIAHLLELFDGPRQQQQLLRGAIRTIAYHKGKAYKRAEAHHIRLVTG